MIPPQRLERIREAFKQGNYTLRLHGFERMIERGIQPQAIRQIVLEGEPIEFDPAGSRGDDDSVLFNGRTADGQPLHVKVTERKTSKGFRHFVITAYEPSLEIWHNDFSHRR